MKVHFVETRQIRRNHKTVQWRAGETYEHDPEMDSMIKIGHARIVAEGAPAVEVLNQHREPSRDVLMQKKADDDGVKRRPPMAK